MCKFADGRTNNAVGLRAGKYTKSRVCSIKRDFSDRCIDRNTVPERRYQYKFADNDESQGDSARVGIVIRELVSISSRMFINIYKFQCFQEIVRFENR